MFAKMGSNIISGVSVDHSGSKDCVLTKKTSLPCVGALNNSTDPGFPGQVQLHSVLKYQQKDNFLTQQ